MAQRIKSRSLHIRTFELHRKRAKRYYSDIENLLDKVGWHEAVQDKLKSLKRKKGLCLNSGDDCQKPHREVIGSLIHLTPLGS